MTDFNSLEFKQQRTLSNEHAFSSPRGLPYLSTEYKNEEENHMDKDDMEIHIDEDT